MKNNLLCPVRKCDGLQLASLSEIYFNSFPEEERRPLDDILCRAAAGDKGLNLMLIHASDGNVSGMLTYWDLGDVIYIYVGKRQQVVACGMRVEYDNVHR